ncbi:MAG: PLP-dependent aminotransferase family protein [Rhodospirillaceae bacterium]
MSFWTPDLSGRTGPKYRILVEALAADIAAGALPEGAKLPPQRDLAWALQVTVGTVARAYAEAERQGLVSGEVGRGTFVRRLAAKPPLGTDETPGHVIDMARNRPAFGMAGNLIAPALAALGKSPDLPSLLDYELMNGHDRYRAAGCDWVAREGVTATPENVTLTTGGQHAILAAIGAVSRPGQPVFAGTLTFPGLKLAAGLLDRKVEGLPADAAGLNPEALDRALAAYPGAAVYGMPALHNPTAATMPLARREALAEILRRREGYFIEDGIYAFLADIPLPPLQALAPDRVIYVTSLSKSLSPGLRFGFAVSPSAVTPRLAATAHAAATMPPILLARLAADLISGGSAFTAIEAQKTETRTRLAIAREFLPDACPSATVPHLWLALPDPWRAEAFAAEALRRGVAVTPASVFATTRQAPECVRVSLTAPRDHAQLRHGLGILRQLLDEPPPLPGAVI